MQAAVSNDAAYPKFSRQPPLISHPIFPTPLPYFALRSKLGWYAVFVLATAYTIILAAVGFVAFLWFSGPENTIWQMIMVNGWVTRAVSVSTLCIRNAVDFQAVVATAMLAA